MIAVRYALYPVAVTASPFATSVLLVLFDGCHSFSLVESAPGGTRERPQAEPHLDIETGYLKYHHNSVAHFWWFVNAFLNKMAKGIDGESNGCKSLLPRLGGKRLFV